MSRATEAHVEHIHIAETRGGPVQALASVDALPGLGLSGDRNATEHDADSCDVTLIEAEAVEGLAASGITLDPGESRRNLTTRGVRLNDLVGKEFWTGDVLALGVELCAVHPPCRLDRKAAHQAAHPSCRPSRGPPHGRTDQRRRQGRRQGTFDRLIATSGPRPTIP